MSIDRTFAGEERQGVAIGLRHRFELREVDHLATPAFLDLPQRHHRRRPSGQRGEVIAGVGLGSLRWPGRVAGEVDHAAIGLRDRVVARAAEIVLLAVLPVGADPHDDEARVDRERQLVGDPVAFERPGHRRFHPNVGDLPQRHQQLDPAGVLQIEPHRQFVLGDLGLVAAVGSRAAGQLRRGKAEHIAAGTLDMNHLGAEFGQFRADIGLRDQLAGADHPNPFERPEGGNDARCFRPVQVLDPVRDGRFQILDRILVFDQPWIMRHDFSLSLLCDMVARIAESRRNGVERMRKLG